jgi:hypothetical protein
VTACGALKAVEAYGVERMLAELREQLLNGRCRPQPVRRVYIPMPGRPKERRPLGIPRVRDRVVQTAARLILGADLRGQLPALLVRVPTEADGAPGAGAHPQGRERGSAVGCRDGRDMDQGQGDHGSPSPTDVAHRGTGRGAEPGAEGLGQPRGTSGRRWGEVHTYAWYKGLGMHILSGTVPAWRYRATA